jgi:arginine/lysine/ornithine decarboxylase
MECEYADRQNVVLMATPENTKQDWERLRSWAERTQLVRKKRQPLPVGKEVCLAPPRVMSIREAVFSKSETIPIEQAVGRVCASETVSCPPAIPIAISGERITEEMAKVFLQYGIKTVCVTAACNVEGHLLYSS